MPLNRIPDDKFEEKVVFSYDNAALTATTTVRLWKCPAGKKFVLDRAAYVNSAGLAGDNTNTFMLEIKKGSTQMALVFNTDTNDTPAGASLAADTYVEGALSGTAANLWLSAADVLTALFTMEGTQTLPAGRLVIEGRLI